MRSQICVQYQWEGPGNIFINVELQNINNTVTNFDIEIIGGTGGTNIEAPDCASPRSTPPTIQSASATVEEGGVGNATVTFTASATDPDVYDQLPGRLTYRWFRGGSLSIGTGTLVASGNPISESLPPGTYGDYFVEVTDSVSPEFTPVPGPNTVRRQVTPFTVATDQPPTITDLRATPPTPAPGANFDLICTAQDDVGVSDVDWYRSTSTGQLLDLIGSFSSESLTLEETLTVTTSVSEAGNAYFVCVAMDSSEQTTQSGVLTVSVGGTNTPPEIQSFTSDPPGPVEFAPGTPETASVQFALVVNASDPDEQPAPLSYAWFEIIDTTPQPIPTGECAASSPRCDRTKPAAQGTYRYRVIVSDGDATTQSVILTVIVREGTGEGLTVTAAMTTASPAALPGETVGLDFVSSVLIGGEPPSTEQNVTYEWRVASATAGGSPVVGALIGTSPSLSGVPFSIGTYSVQLVVTAGSLVQDATTGTFVVGTETPLRELGSLNGLSRNQRSMGNLIDVTCAGLQVVNNQDPQALSDAQFDLLARCGALKSLETPEADAIAGISAMDGQEMSALADQARYFSSIQTSAISGRLLALRQGARGVTFAGLSAFDHGGNPIPVEAITRSLLQAVGGNSGDGDSQGVLADSPIGIFVNARYRVGEKKETENSAGFDFDSKGLTIGADYRVSTSFVLGLAASVGSSESDLGSAGKTESDDYALSIYGSRYGANHYLDFLFGYGTLDFDSRRNISYTELGNQSIEATARGKTDGKQYWGGLSAGYDFRRGGWTFGPDFAFTYIRSEIDAFDERMLDNPDEGSGLALSYGDQTVKSMTAQGGVHLSYAWSTGLAVFVPQIRVAFVKEFETDADEIYVRFVESPFVSAPGQPTPSAVIVTDKPDSSYMRWGASISAQFAGGVSGFLSYDTYSSLDSISMDDFTAGVRFQRAFR